MFKAKGSLIPSQVTTHGRNRNDSIYREDSYMWCNHCGHPIHKKRYEKGHGSGLSQPSTQLNGAVTAGDVTITVDSTSGFPTSGYIYIYDTDSVSMNKVAYTGTSGTTFTGCTGAVAHATDMYVRGEPDGGGCPFCHTYRYDG